MSQIPEEIATLVRGLHVQKVSDSTIALVVGLTEEQVADVLRPVKPIRPRAPRRKPASAPLVPPPAKPRSAGANPAAIRGATATLVVLDDHAPHARSAPAAFGECRFIDGDPVPVLRAGRSPYCSLPVQAGSPYCTDHHGRCYSRRERKAS